MRPAYRPGTRTGLLLAAVTQTWAGAVAAVKHNGPDLDGGMPAIRAPSPERVVPTRSTM